MTKYLKTNELELGDILLLIQEPTEEMSEPYADHIAMYTGNPCGFPTITHATDHENYHCVFTNTLQPPKKGFHYEVVRFQNTDFACSIADQALHWADTSYIPYSDGGLETMLDQEFTPEYDLKKAEANFCEKEGIYRAIGFAAKGDYPQTRADNSLAGPGFICTDFIVEVCRSVELKPYVNLLAEVELKGVCTTNLPKEFIRNKLWKHPSKCPEEFSFEQSGFNIESKHLSVGALFKLMKDRSDLYSHLGMLSVTTQAFNPNDKTAYKATSSEILLRILTNRAKTPDPGSVNQAEVRPRPKSAPPPSSDSDSEESLLDTTVSSGSVTMRAELLSWMCTPPGSSDGPVCNELQPYPTIGK